MKQSEELKGLVAGVSVLMDGVTGYKHAAGPDREHLVAKDRQC
jgi:hypothetical protein